MTPKDAGLRVSFTEELQNGARIKVIGVGGGDLGGDLFVEESRVVTCHLDRLHCASHSSAIAMTTQLLDITPPESPPESRKV